MLRLLRMRFAGDQERQFRSQFNREGLGQVRVAGGLAIAVYGAFGVLDVIVARQDLTALLLVRGTFIAYVGLMLGLSHWLPERVLDRVQQALVCSTVVMAVLGLYLMPLVADLPASYASTGTLLVLMFLFVFARVRFVPAMLTSVVVVVVFGASLMLQPVTRVDVAYNAFFLLGFLVIGATTCHALERLRRREYAYEQALRNAFGSYVAVELVDRVTGGSCVVEGEEVEVTLLFADIRGFTSYSEGAQADVVVAYLNDFYATILPVVRAHGGHVNKLMGDGVLASFGAPQELPDHADAGLAAALGMVAAVTDHFGEGLRIGVGLSSGTVIAGTVGDDGKLDYTLIGDTVNTAARVEQLTKTTGDAILFTEQTRRRLTGPWATSARGSHVVRGRAQAVELHTVTASPYVPGLLKQRPLPPEHNADNRHYVK